LSNCPTKGQKESNLHVTWFKAKGFAS